MNIKSLLIGSAAALAAVSGAQAADAIIAAEPEPVEYVRVCDAFGTGYFYIPGTETCLKVGGYVRVQLGFGEGTSERSDYDIFARGRLEVTAKNDTEYGTLTSVVRLRGHASENNAGYDDNWTELEEGYIDLAGFRVGKIYSWWDDDLFSEGDYLSNNTLFASARYVFTGEAFSAGLSVDELTWDNGTGAYDDANIGLTGMLSGAFGPVSATLLGSYDFDYEEFAIRGIGSAELGPGTLSVAVAYASGENTYFNAAEWTVAADYAFKVTDKLTIAPFGQYFWDYQLDSRIGDAWTVGLTAEYAVTEGLTALATVNYFDADDNNLNDSVTGFLRLQRDF
ncbi:porin [Rhizobiaceae bacterium BDR2-2]|uniref:Porin n=1 Tax=Ectorhizobium quercum TaxID=2965071 RepID=A0AAE3SWV2_9HYPH|nr:porin [Ectorhizobium quercum]MCX8999098.1 porin [Ectorhizobium quercum]